MTLIEGDPELGSRGWRVLWRLLPRRAEGRRDGDRASQVMCYCFQSRMGSATLSGRDSIRSGHSLSVFGPLRALSHLMIVIYRSP
jgi:hypothetical protein